MVSRSIQLNSNGTTRKSVHDRGLDGERFEFRRVSFPSGLEYRTSTESRKKKKRNFLLSFWQTYFLATQNVLYPNRFLSGRRSAWIFSWDNAAARTGSLAGILEFRLPDPRQYYRLYCTDGYVHTYEEYAKLDNSIIMTTTTDIIIV